MATWEIICTDVLEWCKNYTGEPFAAILCDPPYALKFMNKAWDNNIAFQPSTWAALAEHLLPGGFVMAFASSRGWHRLACAMEDAGLILQPSIFNWRTQEIADVPLCLGWVTGSSFPKATRIDKKLDEQAGKLDKREVVGRSPYASRRPNPMQGTVYGYNEGQYDISANLDITTPATDLARAWEGHRYGGQILKNALEPIIVAQKPWEGKRLDCIVETGAGALWVDGARIDGAKGDGVWGTNQVNCQGTFNASPDNKDYHTQQHPQGRWPANFVLCHSEGCERVGVKRVKTHWSQPTHGAVEKGTLYELGYAGKDNRVGEKVGYADPDGYERVDAWDCVEDCPVAKLDKQAGERRGGNHVRQSRGNEAEGNEHIAYGKFGASIK